MANAEGHRRFGNVRKRESGRYQIRYPGPDGIFGRTVGIDARDLLAVDIEQREEFVPDQPRRGGIERSEQRFGLTWLGEQAQ